MDIELPNGVVIQDIPEGTPKSQIMAKAIKAGLATEQDFLPVLGLVDREQTTQPKPYKAPSLGEQVVGAAETGLTPRTQAGQEQVETLGKIGAELVPLQPVLPSGLLSGGTKPVIPAVRQATTGARSAVRDVFTSTPTPTTGRASGGAAATPMELVRRTTAEGLPVPVTLTKGAATREAGQLAFEKEQMKGQQGAPLRARAEQNNLEVLQNFDSLMEMTGAEAAQSGFAATGNKVIDALSQGWKGAKAKTSAAYTKAEKAGELEAPVTLDSLATYINENMPESTVAPVISVAKSKGIQLGILTELEDGTVQAVPTTLANTELLRRTVNKTMGVDATNKSFGSSIKQVIDSSTDGVGGDLYKQARAIREQQARKFEGRAIVSNLLTKVKGKDDPKVEASQVFQKSILNGSPEEITFLKRVLYTSGKDGQTSWNEIQGSTIKHIEEVATGGVGTDSMGRKIVSPAKLNDAIKSLDKNGRLDIILGKDKAQKIRDLNEVLQYVQTVPTGTLVNTSGTAGIILAAMAEAGTTGFLTGLPVPVISGVRAATQYVKDRKLKARIEDALKKGD